jgi:hypothetical protein
MAWGGKGALSRTLAGILEPVTRDEALTDDVGNDALPEVGVGTTAASRTAGWDSGAASTYAAM